MTTNTTETLTWSINRLKERNIENSVRNAEILLSHILNCSRIELYLGKHSLGSQELEQFTIMLEDRIKGKPVQYITGRAEFMGFEFIVTPNTFIPRPETEILAETVLNMVISHQSSVISQKQKTGDRGHPPKVGRATGDLPTVILDIGTGCGNIGISLTKSLPNCRIVATDISKYALIIAKENVRLHRLEERVTLLQGDLFAALDGHRSPDPPSVGARGRRSPVASHRLEQTTDKMDIIVSNPPYINSNDMGRLPLEVQFEPSIALDGGSDGLYYYRRIIERSSCYLKPGGYLAMEMGYGQSKDIKKMLISRDEFELEEIVKDLSGIDRVIVARRKS